MYVMVIYSSDQHPERQIAIIADHGDLSSHFALPGIGRADLQIRGKPVAQSPLFSKVSTEPAALS